MQPRTEFLATSVASSLLAIFSRTHQRRRISVVAGYPGIGKTRVIEQFRSLNPGRVAVMELGEGPKGGHSSTSALNFAVAALEEVLQDFEYMGTRRSTNHLDLRRRFWDLACLWGNIAYKQSRQEDFDQLSAPCSTIIFDEAQHLSRGGIEALRSISDAARGGFSPFPIGLIFVGNDEFALKSTKSRPSVLSDAVSDRLLYSVSLDTGNITDDDLSIYLDSRGDFDNGALSLALKYFAASKIDRTFRQADKLIDLVKAEVGEACITTTTVRHVLALT